MVALPYCKIALERSFVESVLKRCDINVRGQELFAQALDLSLGCLALLVSPLTPGFLLAAEVAYFACVALALLAEVAHGLIGLALELFIPVDLTGLLFGLPLGSDFLVRGDQRRALRGVLRSLGGKDLIKVLEGHAKSFDLLAQPFALEDCFCVFGDKPLTLFLGLHRAIVGGLVDR
jgi:hypothetical protein